MLIIFIVGGVSAVLKYVSVSVISNVLCLSIFGSNYVLPSTLCTSGEKTVGTCNVSKNSIT
jgi:hypothetical protein